MNEYYIGNTFFTIMVMTIMMAIVSGNRYMAKETKRGLIFTFAGIMLATIGELIGVLVDGKSEETVILHYIVKVVEFSVAPFISITCANAFFSVSENEKKIMKFIACAHILIEIISVFFGCIRIIMEKCIGCIFWYIWLALHFIFKKHICSAKNIKTEMPMS